MAKVFISYSSKQFREASQVCEYLERHGVLCWMAPRNIDPGSNYASQIVQAIRDKFSSCLVGFKSYQCIGTCKQRSQSCIRLQKNNYSL